MDPRKQECHGLYLYGSGYFAREDEALRQINDRGYSFCDECSHHSTCFQRHRERAEELMPVAVEHFEAERRIAERKGLGGHLFAALKMRSGDADPFMKLAVQNYKNGIAARGLENERQGS